MSRAALQRWQNRELQWCHAVNQWSMDGRWVWRYFATVSRLGDGLIWYLLMVAILLIDGAAGAPTVLAMAVCGLTGLLIYRLIKLSSRRPRPLHADPRIIARVAPLDRYSFPSGHTLQAVGFSIVVLASYPGLTVLLLPVVLSIALSRVVLGLHYPSDVVMGATIGASLGQLSVTIFGLSV